MNDIHHQARSLNGWKAIAAYCQRDERTVMRWARDRGLPVHRVPGGPRSPVYALPDELTGWFDARDRPEATPVAVLTAVLAAASVAAPTAALPPSRPKAQIAVLTAVLVAGAVGIAANRTSVAMPVVAAPVVARSIDHVAEAAYLQGRYDLSTRTAPGLARAAIGFTRAIARDPKFAEAHAALGETFLMLREYGSMPDAEAYPRARRAARAAIALDPDNAAAHRVLGFTSFWWEGDVAAARGAFAEALRLAPNDAETHHWLATALSANGEHRAALAQILGARRLDPRSSAILADQGYILTLAGQTATGQALIREVQAAAPRQASPYHYLAEFALAAGDGATYLEQAEACASLRGDAAAVARVAAARQGFATDGFDGLLAALAAAQPDMPSPARTYALARLAALRGDAARALGLLSRLKGPDRSQLAFIAGDIAFQRWRADSRFAPYFKRPSLIA